MRGSWLLNYVPLVTIWGASYAVTEVALGAFTPTEVALWRAVIGAGFLVLVLVVGGKGLPRLGFGATWRILLLGVITTVAQVSSASAQLRMSSGMVAVLCSTTPLIAILGYRLRRAPIPPLKWVSVSLGVVGVAVLLSPEVDLDNVGIGLGLLTAGLFATAGILGADFFPDSTFTPTQLTATQLGITAILLTPSAIVGEAGHGTPSWQQLAALLALGVLAAGTGNVLFWRVLRTAGPVVVATTYQTVPVVAVVIGAVAFNETLGIAELVGIALVLGGLLLLLPLVRTSAVMMQDPKLEEFLIGVHCEETCICGNLAAVREEHRRRLPAT